MVKKLSKEDIWHELYDENTNRLRTDAQLTGDVQIGAVELKDESTDVRANIVTEAGGKNALVVVLANQVNKTKVNNFGSSIVAPGVTFTLTSFTVPANTLFTFLGGLVGGNEAGEFYFEINGVTVGVYRNSGSNRSSVVTLLGEPNASAGSVISIKVKNISNQSKSFESTLFGYHVPV